ncbi:MAG: hypothetical protein ACFFC7_10900 [Candidatus Hermodarchaeota archaeon]
MKPKIIDLQTNPNLLPCAREGHVSVIEGARDQAIKDLSDLLQKNLLRGRVLIDSEDVSQGLILYGLVEESLCNLTGKDILNIFCLEVKSPERGHNYGEELIHSALKDYPENKIQGISTSSYGEFWMSERYFQGLGFHIFRQDGLLTHLFKPLVEDATPPSLIKLNLPPYDSSIVVDHFKGPTYCPFGKSFELRILSIIKDFVDVPLREHIIQSREDVLKFGTTPARIFINGTEPSDDPTLSDSELKEQIQLLLSRK